ncbi:MAG: ABC transporter substrate-binding protein, partial [Pseudomonadota bacterium]
MSPVAALRTRRVHGLPLATLALIVSFAIPAEAGSSHGVSAFGELKYAKDFEHFEYVNPNAPKGGRLSMVGTAPRTTFDSFNEFIVKGVRAQGLTLLYDTLLTRAWDEPDAAYGLLASGVERASDDKSVTFYIRKEAKFADGKPVTASDVVFSFETLSDPVKAHPSYATSLRDIAKAEAIDRHTVRFTYKPDRQTRDLPQRIGAMPVLATHWVTANDFTKSGLKKPVGSGPYEIADFKQGRYVTYR